MATILACHAHPDDIETLAAIPHLYWVDPIGGPDRDGRPVQPDFGVDISKHIQTKSQMLLCHDSQHAWVANQHGLKDYLDSMRGFSARQGRDLGVAFAKRLPPVPQHPLILARHACKRCWVTQRQTGRRRSQRARCSPS